MTLSGRTVGAVSRDRSTEEFFEGTARGAFLIRRCAACGLALRPQAKLCSACGGTDLPVEEAAGRARLVSWVVVPGPPVVVPAIAQLEEGPWWWSALVGADTDALAEGTPLRIEFEQPDGSEAVPVFVLASS